ncbi:hypothetical protein BKA65DRAFT_513967 [Rhexocercosporidium sp. MPI-PUGE-AT-0058]|nr:hypothetical protein BKA65DRAFT_513967 [Rhexocercosporidium sp. MPI-PUGE-AT-0058]
MLAKLTARTPLGLKHVPPRTDGFPWGVPYVPGSSSRGLSMLAAGIYTLKGQMFGSAEVNITHDAVGRHIRTIALDYHNFSDNGENLLNGREEVTDFTNLSKSPASLHTN